LRHGTSITLLFASVWIWHRRLARRTRHEHFRSKPYHRMTQGTIKRWHLSLKSRILLYMEVT
jgi:hypothetical protein